MSILMPLIMMVAVVGVGLYALNRWNPAATAAAAPVDATAVAPTTTTGTCTEGTKCSCSECCGGKGCKGGKDNAKMTGGTQSDGRCTCKCEDGCGTTGRSSKTKSTREVPKHRKFTSAQIKKLAPSTKPAGAKPLRPPLFGGAYARAYNARVPRLSVPSISSRMLVEVPNDNADNFTTPRSYFTYESDQPEYYITESTGIPSGSARRAYSATTGNEATAYDEQQNSMPFIHMYDTIAKAPLRFGNY